MKYSNVFICLALYIMALAVSWYLGICGEDTLHFTAWNIVEAWEIIEKSYNETNARIGELLLYFIGISSKGTGVLNALWFYRILNPLFIVACVIFIYRIGTGEWPSSNNKASVITLLFVALCIIGHKCGFYWLGANMNWFYPTVIALLFFIIVEPFFYGRKLSVINYSIAFCCVPLVGMGNEVVSIVSMILFIIAGSVFQYKKKSWKLNKQFLSLGTWLLLFLILYYTAPGPYKRGAAYYSGVSRIEFAVNNVFSSQWLHVLFWYWRLIFISIIVILICPFRYWKTNRGIILACSVIMSGGILVFAPHFGVPRALIPVSFAVIAFLSGVLFRSIHENVLSLKKIVCLFCVLIGLGVTIVAADVVRCLHQIRIFSMIEEKAKIVKSRGEDILVLRGEDVKIDRNNSLYLWGIKIPRTIFEIYNVYPMYNEYESFFATRQKNFEEKSFEHKYAFFQYYPNEKIESTDFALNRGWAKHFGLTSIFILKKDESKDAEGDGILVKIKNEHK